MQTKHLLIGSVLLNAVLLGAVSYVKQPHPAVSPAAPQPAPTVLTAKPAPTRRVTASVEPSPTATAAAERFNWRQVESDDYKRYIANLRAIGCPEETIRDIIIADVNKLFAPRLSGLWAKAKDYKPSTPSLAASPRKLNAEFQKQMRELNREKWALLADLLGPDAEAEFRRTALSADALAEELSLGFLPEAKRAQVRDIAERFQALEQEIQQRTGGAMTPKDRADLKKLREQRQAELAALLSPQELEEYDLRTSGSADSLRGKLAAVPVSDDQFRQLFKLQKAYEDEFMGAGKAGDPTGIGRMVQAQRQLEDSYKAVLGDQGYADYKRSQDPAYRALLDVAKDFNVSQETVGKVYEMKRLVDDQMRQMMSDPNLPRDQRVASIQTIARDTEQAMKDLLGPNAYDAYKQNGGSWVPSATGTGFIYSTSDGGGAVRVMKMDSVTTRDATGAGGGALPDLLFAPGGGTEGGTKVKVIGGDQKVIVKP